MSSIRFQLNDELKEAFRAVCREYNVSMSAILRGKIREVVESEADEIPDEIYAAAHVGNVKDQQRPFQQAMHLPNNFAEETRNLITKQYPPHPEEVEDMYADPYKDILETVYDSPRDKRKKAQIDNTLRTYERLHPDTETGDVESTRDAVVNMAVGVKIEEDMEAAKEFIGSMVRDGILPEQFRDECFDLVREKSREEWQAEWNEKVGHQMEAN